MVQFLSIVRKFSHGELVSVGNVYEFESLTDYHKYIDSVQNRVKSASTHSYRYFKNKPMPDNLPCPLVFTYSDAMFAYDYILCRRVMLDWQPSDGCSLGRWWAIKPVDSNSGFIVAFDVGSDGLNAVLDKSPDSYWFRDLTLCCDNV